MSLLTDWREYAYNQDPAKQKTVGQIWEHYFAMEKELYIQLLSNPDVKISGTVEDLPEPQGQGSFLPTFFSFTTVPDFFCSL